MSEDDSAYRDFAEPQPSARVIGCSAQFMFRLATEEGTLNGKEAEAFRIRADELRDQGLHLSGQFFGARMFAVSVPEAISVATGGPSQIQPEPIQKAAYFQYYVTKRMELKAKVDQFWAELQVFKKPPKRKRGGQPGRMKYGEVDLAMHVQTVKAGIECGFATPLSACRRKVVKSFISERKLPSLGGEDTNNSVAAHCKRLAANWPNFVKMFELLEEQWKLNAEK